MNCSSVRRVLYPNPEQAETTIERAEALEHLRSCADCAAVIERSEKWADVLREKVGETTAPESLRTALVRATAFPASPAARARDFLSRRIVLGAVAVMVSLCVWIVYPPSSDEFFRDACEDHARYLNADVEISSSEPGSIESWFRGRTNLAIQVPAFDDTTLLGGRLCFLRGKRSALVFYSKRERPVSLFQFSKEGVNLRGLERSVIDGAPIWRGSYRGFNLVAFEQRGMIYTLVSDLRESELLELASSAHVQSRGY